MECDKEHFFRVIYYFTTLIRKKRLPKLTNSFRKLILSLLHQLRAEEQAGFDNSKVMISI